MAYLFSLRFGQKCTNVTNRHQVRLPLIFGYRICPTENRIVRLQLMHDARMLWEAPKSKHVVVVINHLSHVFGAF